MSNYSHAVFIGRFQPVHAGHLRVIESALEKANELTIFVGSSNEVPTIRNPWSFDERYAMIERAIQNSMGEPTDEEIAERDWIPGPIEEDRNLLDRIQILPLRDYLYNESYWTSEVYAKASNAGAPQSKTTALFGCYKDDSSYYLDMFPRWSFEQENYYYSLDATDIREKLYESGQVSAYDDKIMTSTAEFLNSWIDGEMPSWIQPKYKNGSLPGDKMRTVSYPNGQLEVPISEHILGEWDYYRKKREQQQAAKSAIEQEGGAYYPPQANTVDVLVKKSGCALLIQRGFHPGKGQWALPGGYVGPNEKLRPAAIRELKEETNISIHKQDIKQSLSQEPKTFDHPRRNLGPVRKVTNVFVLDLDQPGFRGGPLPDVEAGTDAATAQWITMREINEMDHEFFEDHFSIINNMT